MHIDIFSQRIIAQLTNLYESAPENWHHEGFKEPPHGFVGLYNDLYDFLISDGHKIEFSKDERSELWRLAKIKFNKENKRLIQVTPKIFEQKLRENEAEGDIEKQAKEMADNKLKKELNNVFKSFLARKYLMDRLYTKGALLITDQYDRPVRLINVVGYKK